jgi:hypothetical protein
MTDSLHRDSFKICTNANLIGNLIENIDRQLESNKGKNLFYNRIINSLRFIPETIEAIEKIDKLDVASENLLIDNLATRVLQEFCAMNQYYTFNESSKIALKNIYFNLFFNIKNNKSSLDSIAKTHYKSLIKWLQKTNPFAEMIYTSKDEIIEPIACAEYSPDIQIDILQIDIKQIIEPVLDIGCGKKANLVMHLRQNGIEAYGFDRFVSGNSFLTNSDWLEYEFVKKRWGTIISNLGFSNHFIHHHLRNDGSFIDYAKQFMNILNSLKIGGSFYYAPDLPFVEQHLDENKFRLTKHKIGDFDFKSINIKRLY